MGIKCTKIIKKVYFPGKILTKTAFNARKGGFALGLLTGEK
jgi:hypothetical protein